ncbi:MAG: hemerythrin domain-containing protein [Parasphingopyxis sp.]|nr:hemerythrin domain-containing protein [Sphingomonadales bacterium]
MKSAAPDIAKARAEHDEILVLLGRLETALAEPSPPAGLDRIRREAAVKVRSHLAHEDWTIYPWLLSSESDVIVETARRLFAESADFAGALAAHLARWPAERAAADWDNYRAAAQPLIKRLRLRTKAENEELYRLLLEERSGEAA